MILILADGMRPDTMAHLSYVQEIMAKSAYTMQAETVFPSVTLPCHMSLFLGVPAQRHGVTTNVYTPPARPMSGLCEQLNLARKSCAVFYDWEELRDLWRPGSVAYARLEREQTKEVSDRSTDAALAYIAERSPDFVFLYLGWPDAAGHGVGWMTPTYMQSVVDVWEDIRRVIEQCGEEYTIFITADHGGHDRAHGSLNGLEPIRFSSANICVSCGKNPCNIRILLQIFPLAPLNICSTETARTPCRINF